MGSWGSLGPALLSLAGVALGAGGSLFGQYLVSRVSARQLEIEESAAHRAELKNAVLKLLGVANQLEKEALTRPRGASGAADPALERLVDDLWLAQAEIDLSARSEELRGAAYRYASRLAEAARGEVADASALRGPQVRFFDAAYDDMWPGRRRTAGGSVTSR
ncbi:hypothetical protein OG562_18605 [Streptomyces sp. NBC_01275]|uniref:hypothetical protein n=1 Tax=Streptomyces sp. NBC_01275 TaxID=2903807 RepID=UPI002254FF92|nr:hypothetical protein [Streptomyces sp. NBC_01275]MCX4762952.1 hypothetical protein [Streptomyces sp. NBC_01275]